MVECPRTKKVNFKDNVDNINKFPDEILCHILSFLPTKESVKTSILSRRWKPLSAYVPALILDTKDFYGKWDFAPDPSETLARFLNYMYKSLIDQDAFLEKVNLRASPLDIFCENIRCIGEKFGPKSLLQLPHCLFNCKNLVALELSIKMVLNFTSTRTCFPDLKILKLDSVIYEDADSLRLLILTCPVLEDLVIVRTGEDKLKILNLCSKSLKKISVRRVQCFLPCLTYDELPHLDRETVIDAPALESLDIIDHFTEKYKVTDFSCVTTAKIDVCAGGSLFRVINRLINVRSLVLSSSTLWSLSAADFYRLPTFAKLKSIRFEIEYEVEVSLRLVLEFLRSSPMLEDLVFKGFLFYDTDVPNYTLPNLKTITILDLDDEDDVKTVIYFIENAKVLEKMTINVGSEDIKAKLLKLPRGSTECSGRHLVISFI